MAALEDADQRPESEQRRRAAAGFIATGGMALGMGGLLFLLTSSADAVARTLLFVGAGALQLAGVALFVLAGLALAGRLGGSRRPQDPAAVTRRDRRQAVAQASAGVLFVGLAGVLLATAWDAEGFLRAAIIGVAVGVSVSGIGWAVSAVESYRRWRARA